MQGREEGDFSLKKDKLCSGPVKASETLAEYFLEDYFLLFN